MQLINMAICSFMCIYSLQQKICDWSIDATNKFPICLMRIIELFWQTHSAAVAKLQKICECDFCANFHLKINTFLKLFHKFNLASASGEFCVCLQKNSSSNYFYTLALTKLFVSKSKLFQFSFICALAQCKLSNQINRCQVPPVMPPAPESPSTGIAVAHINADFDVANIIA